MLEDKHYGKKGKNSEVREMRNVSLIEVTFE